MEIWQPAASSNIAEGEYDPDVRLMRIAFRDGSAYQYSGVPPEVWLGLQHAASAGSYFHRNIKGRYRDERIEG